MKVKLINLETGESYDWDGITKIEDEEEHEESLSENYNKFADELNKAIQSTLIDDKTPNPIYIPKHVQHRKKGRK